MLALSPSFMLFLGPGRGGKGRMQARFFWVVVPRDAIPSTPSWFGAGLRCCSGDFSSWEALICMGKDPTLHRYSFVNFLCDWAQNGCVNNSAGEDGRAKRWQLLCYEICINCIKHSVWTSAARPLLSVFIECRQSPGCRWQWASGWTPMLKHPELLLRCSRHGLRLPTQQRSAQGARSPALTLWGPPPRLCSPDATDRDLTLSQPTLMLLTGERGRVWRRRLGRACSHQWTLRWKSSFPPTKGGVSHLDVMTMFESSRSVS